ncbi:MmgE/PrpD family protein [Chloroflexota bacterium]
MKNHSEFTRSIISQVSTYISQSGQAKLPAQVIAKAKIHILDTLAAIISGSKLKPGKVARRYALQQAGIKEAQVAGSHLVTSAVNAALANGIMAHADETDDSHPESITHLGCAIVPAALAMSEREGADGMSFIRGVVAGYDIGCRIPLALGVDIMRRMYRSSHSVGGVFGAAAAASSISQLGDDMVRYVLSYTAQQASGVRHYVRDAEHIEKAFVFGGMPVRNGVAAATMVQSGFTGVTDPFSGRYNFFESFSPEARPGLLVADLGHRYEIMFTNIKRFSVGSPIQAALDALLLLLNKRGFTSNDVHSIVARVPGAAVVDNRNMPDINLQYILAVALLDGKLTFEQAHSYERMSDPAVIELKKRITLVDDAELAAAVVPRQGIVEVITEDGSQFKEHVVSVRGTVENPMTVEEVAGKCRELMAPVLGEDGSQELISKVLNLEQVGNMRELRPFLSVFSK